MKTIQAKQTIAGSYGQLNAGETKEVTDKIAADLEKAGLVEIVEDGQSDAEDKKSESGVKITDNTRKEKVQLTEKAEKKADAGPAAHEKKSDAGLSETEDEAKKKETREVIPAKN